MTEEQSVSAIALLANAIADVDVTRIPAPIEHPTPTLQYLRPLQKEPKP